MKFSTLLLTPLFVCTSAVLADEEDHDDHGDHHGEEHYDIGLYASNGVMTVGGWDHDTGSMEVANLRLFEAHFGEDPAFPYSIDEPGIGGTADLLGMAPGDSFSMNLIAGVRAWDGSGFSSSAESMGVSFGPASVDAALGGSIAITATEDFDLHPEYFIDSGAATGSYLLEFTFSAAGLATSESIYIVFNNGMDDELFEETVEWAEANIVPVQGAWLLLGGLGLRRRNRRG